MGRYSDLYRELDGREPTDFPPTYQLKLGKRCIFKILTEPRKVRGGFGRLVPLIEVEEGGNKYSLYLSWTDLRRNFSLIETEMEKKGETSMVGKKIYLKLVEKGRKGRMYKFDVKLLSS